MKEFKFNIDGKEIKATVVPQEEGKLAVTLNDTTYTVEVPELAKHAPRPVVGGRSPAWHNHQSAR